MARSGRQCSICAHPARAHIDAALISGRAHADLAREFRCSDDAIGRHGRRHVNAVVAASADHSIAMPSGDIDLVDSLASLRNRLMNLLARAEKARDTSAAVLCVREAVRLIEVYGKLTGAIGTDGVHVSINTGSAGRRDVRERILAKLNALAAPTVEGSIITQKGDFHDDDI